MLYFLHGENKGDFREKLNRLIHALLARKPNASFFKMDEETFTASALEEYIGGQGLFESKYIVVLDGVVASSAGREEVLSHLKEIRASDNIFIIFEEGVDAKTARRIERYAEKSQVFGAGKKKTEKKFDIFSLSDAFGRRDKKTLWVLSVKAMREGIAPEEICGILFWQAKSMLTVAGVASPDRAPLNPFVVRKSLGFLKNYEEGELRSLLRELASLYHEARRGADFETNLERFVIAL